MKIRILFFIISLSTGKAYAQSTIVSDSLIGEICKTLIKSREFDDSVKVFKAFELHLGPALSKIDDSLAMEAFNYTFFQLQKFCKEFKTILDRLNPPKGDWTSLESKPATKLQKKTCREFLNHNGYYYLETNGDTVKLSLANNLWVDHFKDGTSSKLKIGWTNDCELEITFIESDNEIRKNYSKPGDKYKYHLLEKNNSYYTVCLEIKEANILEAFRIYYY